MLEATMKLFGNAALKWFFTENENWNKLRNGKLKQGQDWTTIDTN